MGDFTGDSGLLSRWLGIEQFNWRIYWRSHGRSNSRPELLGDSETQIPAEIKAVRTQLLYTSNWDWIRVITELATKATMRSLYIVK